MRGKERKSFDAHFKPNLNPHVPSTFLKDRECICKPYFATDPMIEYQPTFVPPDDVAPLDLPAVLGVVVHEHVLGEGERVALVQAVGRRNRHLE